MLCVDTPIPTPDGWTAMGDLSEGDEVFSEQGLSVEVVEAYNVTHRPICYRVRFDDGTEIDACADHLWKTLDARDLGALTRRDPEWRARRRERRPSRVTGNRSELFTETITARNVASPPPCLSPPTGTIRTTREIAESLRVGRRTNHAIPVAKAIDLPHAELPLGPYLLGAWLGDGTSAAGSVTTADPQIVESFTAAGWQRGNTQTKPGNAASTYHFFGLYPLLRRMGVAKNKHIPAEYLRTSRNQRLALLEGLMDTDGWASKTGSVEFTSTTKALVDGVYELIVSLGWKARIVEGRATLYGKDCGPKWDIKWTPSDYVFRLERKRDRQNLAARRTTRFRYIVACDRIDPKPMRCIAVDNPTGLFLAGRSMVPTHNSEALLMGALQYVSEPDYAALLLRKTYKDLALPGALMDRAHSWLKHRGDVHWNDSDKKYTFPSGATLTFGYLATKDDHYQYQSSEFHYIGFDELTQFPENQYRYLFSRLRRESGSRIPIRMRSGSNPGGKGHDWVKQRFLESDDPSRLFIPASIDDNPHLDQVEYVQALSHLDPLTLAQLLKGDWDARYAGSMFRREWFNIIDVEEMPQANYGRPVRFWDIAATEDEDKDPDYTVGVKMQLDERNRIYVMDVRRGRYEPAEGEAIIRATAESDGKATRIRMWQEPGASGKGYCHYYARHVLFGWDFEALPETGPKHVRARPYAAQVGAGNVWLIRGSWLDAYLDELEAFGPDESKYAHDDQVDPSAGAFLILSEEAGFPHGPLRLRSKDRYDTPMGVEGHLETFEQHAAKMLGEARRERRIRGVGSRKPRRSIYE